MTKIGIQLYTVRDELEKDYEGTIRTVATLGYHGVEFPGGTMHSIAAKRLKELLAELRLDLCGLIFEAKELRVQMEEIIAYCKQCDCTSVVMPCVPFEKDDTPEDFRDIALDMNAWGKTLNEAGISFALHVHGNEFEQFGEKTGWDILKELMDPRYVQLEIDVYWVEHAGQDSVSFLQQNIHATKYLHLKDFANRETMEDTEVGAGCIPMQQIVNIAIKNQIAWVIVEQEQFHMPSMESAKISLANIQTMLQYNVGAHS